MKRVNYIDNCKAILIFLVVFGHIIEPIRSKGDVYMDSYILIYSFHMPAFAFLSGIVCKLDFGHEFVKKQATSLLVPMISFTIIYELFNFIAKGDISHYSYNLQPYWMMWFLVSLFTWKLLIYPFNLLKHPIIVAIIISILAGYFKQIGYFAGLSRTIYFFPFFLFGYYCKEDLIGKVELSRRSKLIVITVFILGLAIVYALKDWNYRWYFGTRYYGYFDISFWEGSIYRLLTIALSLALTVSLVLTVGNSEGILSKVGRNSLYTFLIHGLIIKTLIELGFITKLENYLGNFTYILMLSISVIIVYITSRNKVKKFVDDYIFNSTYNILAKLKKLSFR